MAIYEARGFSSFLYPYRGNLTPFEYIAQFKPMKVPERADIGQFKRTQAPYCISGKVTADKKGTHRRNNNSLVYRDLIFLDYDELEASTDLPKIVSNTLSEYSYIIYPTIKHTPMTNTINARFDHINGESLVKIPNNNPNTAGATSELGPSEIVGVAIIANTMIQVIPPRGEGKRFAIEYQHHKIKTVPRT